MQTRIERLRGLGSPDRTDDRPFTKFYSAEEYHQDYYQRNPHKGYCAVMIRPKVEKFRKVFKDKLKGG